MGCAMRTFYLVPKLLLGNGIVAQALLGHLHIWQDKTNRSINFAKGSLAPQGVPKQELGNQENHDLPVYFIDSINDAPISTREVRCPGSIFMALEILVA